MNRQTHPSADPLVLCGHGLGAAYGRIQVVFDVDIEVRRGELVGILGPNGAGKSSLLGAIAGAVRGNGELSLNGIALTGLPAHRRAGKGLAFVPERRGNVFGSMTVAENLEIGMRMAPKTRREAIHEHIGGLFPILMERLNAQAGMLSGGEQQMLAIGMALGREPDVLILDEPSQGLAPVIFDLLHSAFETLKKEGIGLLMAEQNLPFAAQVADRYLVLSHGVIVSSGDRDDLKQHDQLMAAYLSAD